MKARYALAMGVLLAAMFGCAGEDPVAPSRPRPDYEVACVDYSEWTHWVGGVEMPFLYQITYQDGYGYFGYMTDDREVGFGVVDLARPDRPEIVGRLAMPFPGLGGGVAVNGDLAFLVYSPDGCPEEVCHYLVVLDVSDPASPTVAATLDGLVRADAIYVAGGNGVQIIGISEPRLPVNLGWSMVGQQSNGIAVSPQGVVLANNQGISVGSPQCRD